MYEGYWGLRARPFRSEGSAESYVPSPVHDEALARLHYLVEANHRLGLLLGGAGSGKSLLLAITAEQWQAIGANVARTSLLARDAREAVWSIASGWGLNLDMRAGLFEMWRAVGDKLAENRWCQVPTVALLDDADRASAEVLDQVVRLVHAEPTAESPLTVVLAVQADRVSELAGRLLSLVELRIDLLPWDLTDTHNYLIHCLARAGRAQSAFDEQAVMRIHDLSQGIVRRIALLADLSLLAAAGQRLPMVDAHTIETVYDELGVMEEASSWPESWSRRVAEAPL
ncbi:MAG TPA: AAA family ATPase [Pirellulales bacterium]|jgi:general secretion pathway protein A|nr:AAA family ATPase [Pirellulales bacterium]